MNAGGKGTEGREGKFRRTRRKEYRRDTNGIIRGQRQSRRHRNGWRQIEEKRQSNRRKVEQVFDRVRDQYKRDIAREGREMLR